MVKKLLSRYSNSFHCSNELFQNTQFPFQVPQSPKPLEFVKLEPLDIDDEASIDTSIAKPREVKRVSKTVPKKLPVASVLRHKCQQCDASFTSVKSLSAHMRVHKINNVKVVKTSNTQSLIKKEVANTIAEKLQWICNICNTEFSSLKSLK